MYKLWNSFWRSLIRISTFVRKETVAILRQPQLVFTLILGPFLILLIFGIGYRDQPATLDTILVVPADSAMGQEVRQYVEDMGSQIRLVAVMEDDEAAKRRLRTQEVDLVLVTPVEPSTDILNNRQSTFQLYHSAIDPFEATYVQIAGQTYIEDINRQVLMFIAEQGKAEAQRVQEKVGLARETAATVQRSLQRGEAGDARQSVEALSEEVDLMATALGSGLAAFSGVRESIDGAGRSDTPTVQGELEQIREHLQTLSSMDVNQDDFSDEQQTAAEIEQELGQLDRLLTQYRDLEPHVLVSPFRIEVESVTPISVQPTHFYVPAVIALLLQHIAVILGGLSIVRDNRQGTMELFRASPISALEVLLGKYVSYLLLTSVLAALITALVLFVLQVPMLGNWWSYGLVLLAVLAASLGVGFVISLVAKSDSQAIQYSMIVLLASIFFSGFFLALYRLRSVVHVVSWSLPATYGISMLQDVMLRGQAPASLLLLALFAYGLVFFLIAWRGLRRHMANE